MIFWIFEKSDMKKFSDEAKNAQNVVLRWALFNALKIFKNKWKISCGIADKESLIVNGKPKTKYSIIEFKLDCV